MKLTHCPTHAIILDAAREEMATNQRFMKGSVLATAGFGKYGHLIQWPYIREVIEKELGGEALQPIANAPPTTNGHAWDPEIHPEKFLPGANNPTAGYARATTVAPAVARKYAQRRYNVMSGYVRATDRVLTSYQRQGLISGYKPMTMQPLQLSAQS